MEDLSHLTCKLVEVLMTRTKEVRYSVLKEIPSLNGMLFELEVNLTTFALH
jgi:hypothetical protein